MSVINGCLFDGIVQFHDPVNHANTAVIVIDEINGPCVTETLENCEIRQKSQQDVLHFCKNIGCLVISVNDHNVFKAKHIYNIIGEPDFLCVKQHYGVLASSTTPRLMDYIKDNNITSLVLMGQYFNMCVNDSLLGSCINNKRYYPGLLSKQITVLSSPKLLGPYSPELYLLKPKFTASATSFKYSEPPYFQWDLRWPVFALHRGMKFYTKIKACSDGQ